MRNLRLNFTDLQVSNNGFGVEYRTPSNIEAQGFELAVVTHGRRMDYITMRTPDFKLRHCGAIKPSVVLTAIVKHKKLDASHPVVAAITAKWGQMTPTEFITALLTLACL